MKSTAATQRSARLDSPAVPPTSSSTKNTTASGMRATVIALGSWGWIAMGPVSQEGAASRGSVAPGQLPGVLVVVAVHDRLVAELRLDGIGVVALVVIGRERLRLLRLGRRLGGRRGCRLGGRLLALELREHRGQLLGRHEHVTRLGSLRRPDDLARLEQVHEATRLREADAQLALQHR